MTPRESQASAPDARPAPQREIRRLRAPLLRWYRRHRRELPWRQSRDPYAIWVSEVMLQQTQVATVIPYYARFLERFPDAGSLARASEDEVLSLWSGLGYYRRARALRAGALAVMERHGGKLPADPAALRRLPGIGRYTAGAIASIGFDLPEPVLDGNVRRVLTRLIARRPTKATGRTSPAAGRDATLPAAAPTDSALWSIAGILAQGPHPGQLNQALMELGALVCTPRAPRCSACPVRRPCGARALGDPESYPPPKIARPAEKVRVAVALVERANKLLLERPSNGNPFRGTWDLPAVELGPRDDARGAMLEALARRHGLEVRLGDVVAHAGHGILQRRLELQIFRGPLRRGRVRGRAALCWVSRDELAATPVSGATGKCLRLTAAAAG